MHTLTCVAILAEDVGGIVTGPSVILVTNDVALWQQQPVPAGHDAPKSALNFVETDSFKVLQVLSRELHAQLHANQVILEGDKLEFEKGQPFHIDQDEVKVGGVIRCFRPENGNVFLQFPLYGSNQFGRIGGFASQAAARAWAYTVNSALSTTGVISPGKEDWYEIILT